MSPVEHRFLKWIDLIEMLRLRSELLECCSDAETSDLLQECLDWATQIADQTDLVADSGILVYLQDTSATRLSTFGIILHKVSLTSARAETVALAVRPASANNRRDVAQESVAAVQRAHGRYYGYSLCC